MAAQSLVGNRAVAMHLARQDETVPADAAIDVVTALKDRLTSMYETERWELDWTKKQRNLLGRWIAKPSRLGDEALAEALTALDRRERRRIVKEVPVQVRGWLDGAKVALRAELEPLLETVLADRFTDFATHASTADGGAPTPLFPLAFKYLVRNGVTPLLKNPTTKARLGDAVNYSNIVGVARDGAVFPGLHDPTLVTTLNRMPTKQRLQLVGHVTVAAVDWASPYFSASGVTGSGIQDEYALLGSNLASNIEGGLAGYVSVRPGLLSTFGDPAAPLAALAAAKSYYDALKSSGFLVGLSGGTSTLVHPDLATALQSAENLMKTRPGWHDTVGENVKKYWSTNVRENRNSPSRLSQHSFGFALDINPGNNPNLSSKGNKRFIQDMAGSDVFYEGSSKKRGAMANRVRNSTDTDDLRAGAEAINDVSDEFRAIFASETVLRARLGAILQERGIDPASADIQGQLDQATAVAQLLNPSSGSKKEKRKKRKEGKKQQKAFAASLTATLWAASPSSRVAPAGGLAAEIIAKIKKVAKSGSRLRKFRESVRALIFDTTRKPTGAERSAGLAGLRKKSIRTQLEALDVSSREAVSNQVLLNLKAMVDRRNVEAVAGSTAHLVVRAFSTMESIPTDRTKVKAGGSMRSVAVHGFANLAPELVASLTSPEGGNLKWLGVHNQDMHHFELKDRPALPKAQAAPPEAAPSAEKPA